MPIYEYRCEDCDRSFEMLVRSGHCDETQCPSCGGVKIRREMSVFASRAADAMTQADGAAAMRGSGGCCGGSCGCH